MTLHLAKLVLLLVAVSTATTVGYAQKPRNSLVLLLIGPPGVGKSLHAKSLARKYKVPAISMQDVLRAELGKKSGLVSKALEPMITSGELISAPEADALMTARLRRPDAGKGFILDGYPTTPAQAESLRRFLTENKYPSPIVILLDAPDEVLKTRMEMRNRADDTPETIVRRIREYRELGRLAADWYGADHLLKVDAAAPAPVVTARVVEQIEEADTTTGFKVRSPAAATAPAKP
ncbi:hypothetical protein F183_A03800 [Bryobacterales bacterium F-183]|nr:hypothetical protein F183_A03800 [Bryobacterales bacterium F-183]